MLEMFIIASLVGLLPTAPVDVAGSRAWKIFHILEIHFFQSGSLDADRSADHLRRDTRTDIWWFSWCTWWRLLDRARFYRSGTWGTVLLEVGLETG